MRGVQRVRNLNCDIQQAFELNWLSSNEMLQRRPVQEFHRDKGLATPLANVVDRANIGMIQCGRRLRFPLKPRSEEHTSELQSHSDLVCRLLLEKKKKKQQ